MQTEGTSAVRAYTTQLDAIPAMVLDLDDRGLRFSWRGGASRIPVTLDSFAAECARWLAEQDVEDAECPDAMVTSYLETALWSSSDHDGVPLDREYGPNDLAPDALDTLRELVSDFYAENAADIGGALVQAGHDLWLTQNRHGAGFWDGGWPEGAAKRLTDAAHACGSIELYIGDDGRVYA